MSTPPKTIVITGASDGIGFESARQLAQQGHSVVLVGRNPEKTRAAAERAGAVASHVVDTSNFASVRRLADALLAEHPRIDVLVNNAGTVYAQRSVNAQRVEMTFATNHLGPFLLTELLRDRLVESNARIVNTASAGHYQGKLSFYDLNFSNGYTIMRAYNRSKLANVLYTRHLAQQLASTRVTVNTLHPGAVATSIWGGAPRMVRPALLLAKRFMISPADGGARLTYLATSPEVEGQSGGYYEKDRLKEPSRLALDDSLAQRLYDVSRELVELA